MALASDAAGVLPPPPQAERINKVTGTDINAKDNILRVMPLMLNFIFSIPGFDGGCLAPLFFD